MAASKSLEDSGVSKVTVPLVTGLHGESLGPVPSVQPLCKPRRLRRYAHPTNLAVWQRSTSSRGSAVRRVAQTERAMTQTRFEPTCEDADSSEMGE
jgi:hypothetical protein